MHKQIREGGTHRWCVFPANLPSLKPSKNDSSNSHSRTRQIRRDSSMMKTPPQHQQQAEAGGQRVTVWAGPGAGSGRSLNGPEARCVPYSLCRPRTTFYQCSRGREKTQLMYSLTLVTKEWRIEKLQLDNHQPLSSAGQKA